MHSQLSAAMARTLIIVGVFAEFKNAELPCVLNRLLKMNQAI
jgi:hypothetical protein